MTTAVAARRTPDGLARTAARIGLNVVIVVALLLAVWLVVFLLFHHTRVVPSPEAVGRALVHGWSLDVTNAGVTLREAGIGYVWGNLLALIAAILFVRWAPVERILMPVAVGSYCVPLIAIAPILIIVLPGSGPKEALAGLAVVFTTLISVMLGLRSADPAALDVVHALGGGAWQAIWRVRLPAALPSLLAGLSIAAPAALLGAIVGEYLGASSGLGVALLQAQSSFQVARTYSLALVMAILAGAVFVLVRVVARLVVPWSSGRLSVGLGAPELAGGTKARRRGAGLVWLLASAVLVVVAWALALRLFHLSSYFAKSPKDVLEFVTWGSGAAANRSTLLSAFGRTVLDALPGFLLGTVVASLAAVVIANVSAVNRVVMPVAIALRSIPLIALVPLITLVFGANLGGVTVLVGLIVFFPTLVNVVVGLDGSPLAGAELIRALGGSRLAVVTRIQVRYALPALFASARIAIPAALGGATLAEWLATGKGLGNLLVTASTDSEYDLLWAGAVGLVLFAVICYELLGLAERACLRSLIGGRR